MTTPAAPAAAPAPTMAANPMANHDAAGLKAPVAKAPLPTLAPPAPKPAATSPGVPGFLQQGLSAMKGFLPWKQIMGAGGPLAVAGISGLMQGRNNFADFAQGQKAAQAFGRRLGVALAQSKQ